MTNIPLHAINPDLYSGTQYEYDALGRVKKRINSDDSEVQYDYRRNMDIDTDTTTITDEKGNSTSYHYTTYGANVSGVLMFILHPDETGTSFDRNVLGQPTSIGAVRQNPEDSLWYGWLHYYEYYDNNLLKSHTSFEVGESIYTYDVVGNISTVQLGDSITTYIYDDLYRQKEVVYSDADSKNIFTNYDSNGNILNVTKGETRWDYVYDENDNLKTETLTVNPFPEITREYEISRIFNGLDHMTSLTYPSGLVTSFAPDALGRPTQVGGYASNIHYHPNGAVKSYLLSNGIPVEAELNDRLFNDSIKVGNDGDRIVDLDYTYGPTGNVRSIGDRVNPEQDISIDPVTGYDSLDRLVSAQGPWGDANFEYDRSGNITRNQKGDDIANDIHYMYGDNYLRYTRYDYIDTQTGLEPRYTEYRYDHLGNIIYVNNPENGYLQRNEF